MLHNRRFVTYFDVGERVGTTGVVQQQRIALREVARVGCSGQYFDKSAVRIVAFSCGNSLFVNDIVDNVTEAGQAAAEGCFAYLNEEPYEEPAIEVQACEGILYAVPQKISGLKDVTFSIRASRPMKDTYIVFDNILKKKFKFLTPGEMVFIKIKKDILKGLVESKIRILKIYTESKEN